MTLKGHVSDVWGVAFTPDGKTLVSGDGDGNKPGEVKLWDVVARRSGRRSNIPAKCCAWPCLAMGNISPQQLGQDGSCVGVEQGDAGKEA